MDKKVRRAYIDVCEFIKGIEGRSGNWRRIEGLCRIRSERVTPRFSMENSSSDWTGQRRRWRTLDAWLERGRFWIPRKLRQKTEAASGGMDTENYPLQVLQGVDLIGSGCSNGEGEEAKRMLEIYERKLNLSRLSRMSQFEIL